MNTTPETLKKLRKKEHMTQKEFGALLGVSREIVNKMEKGSIAISSKSILKLRELYGDDLSGNFVEEDDHPYQKGIPVFDVPLSLALLNAVKDGTHQKPLYYLQSRHFAGCTFAALAKNDHAMSEIRSGDYLVCQPVGDLEFIDYSGIYFIAGRNGIEQCRYIHPHPTDDTMLLLQTGQEQVPPSPLPKNYIIQLFRIRGMIRSL